MQVHLQGIQVEFVHEGHRAKVTAATMREMSSPGLGKSMAATAETASPF